MNKPILSNQQHRFIAFDLDGTLLNSKKEVLPASLAALRQLQEDGVKVILASGRHPMGIAPVAEVLDLRSFGGYMLCFNGGKVVRCSDHKTVVTYPLPRDLAVRAARIAKEFGLCPVTYSETALITEEPDNPYALSEANMNHLAVEKVDNIEDYIQSDVNKLLVVGPSEMISAKWKLYQEAVGSEYEISCSSPYFIEVMPGGMDKAESLRRLLATEGFSPENLVAFGDGGNDRSMIMLANIGLAMENAIPDVKAIADRVIGNCETDAIARAIQEIWYS
ncbi:MAG: Cof-type HAD-IIB family hydrolase [Lachnospiraceae bacterium]|nr:Cof-type HAD-IIB family hydrolase [Lachnospiraceae bacterium]